MLPSTAMTGLLVLVCVLIALWGASSLVFKFIGWGKKRAPRCPACLRLGKAQFYGRYHCPACGAAFLLSASGEPVKSFIEAAGQPFLLLTVVVISFFTWADLERDWPKLAIFGAIGAVQLHAAWRHKRFATTEDRRAPNTAHLEV